MNLLDMINENNVFFITNKSKFKVLDELIDKAVLNGKISDKAVFKKAIEDREILMSTGIGLGVAIPHAKIAGITDFFIIIGILDAPVEWDSIDNHPVQAVFLIGGPPQSHTDYLKLLARLIVIVKNDHKRNHIFNARTAQELIDQFT
jgi:nitrogen PTS system EIIA component